MNVDVVIQHAGCLFVWVFLNQSGVPVPVVPSLVAAGALAGRTVNTRPPSTRPSWSCRTRSSTRRRPGA